MSAPRDSPLAWSSGDGSLHIESDKQGHGGAFIRHWPAQHSGPEQMRKKRLKDKGSREDQTKEHMPSLQEQSGGTEVTGGPSEWVMEPEDQYLVAAVTAPWASASHMAVAHLVSLEFMNH